MKVRVKEKFKDKHTGKIYKIGDELDMSIERINEVLKVGSFIELVIEQTEPEQEETEQPEQPTGVGEEEKEADKPATRRKRNSK